MMLLGDDVVAKLLLTEGLNFNNEIIDKVIENQRTRKRQPRKEDNPTKKTIQQRQSNKEDNPAKKTIQQRRQSSKEDSSTKKTSICWSVDELEVVNTKQTQYAELKNE